MMYPNLTAEFEAQYPGAYDRETNLRLMAEQAHVTTELLEAILYGDEDVELGEAVVMRKYLAPMGSFSFEYLFAHKLSTIQPGHKHTVRTRELRALVIAVDRELDPILAPEHRQHARQTLQAMETGEAVRYADWRVAMMWMKRLLDMRREALMRSQHKVRGLPTRSDTPTSDCKPRGGVPISAPPQGENFLFGIFHTLESACGLVWNG